MSDARGELTHDLGLLIFYDDLAERRPTGLPTEIEGIQTEIRPGHFERPFAPLGEQEEFLRPPADGFPLREEDPLATDPREEIVEPMIGGISGSPDFFYITDRKGTIGLVVRDSTGFPLIMSNRHVIGGKDPEVGDGVSQPARTWLGDLAASLVAWEQNNILIAGRDYGMDVAVARPTNDRTASIGQIYNLPTPFGGDAPNVGKKVVKSGIGSNITNGTIGAVNVDIRDRDNNDLIMRNQITIRSTTEDFAAPGDSGSAVIDTESNRVVALLWGFNHTGREGCATPILPILDHFRCTLL
jgi:hypothetical protein